MTITIRDTPADLLGRDGNTRYWVGVIAERDGVMQIVCPRSMWEQQPEARVLTLLAECAALRAENGRLAAQLAAGEAAPQAEAPAPKPPKPCKHGHERVRSASGKAYCPICQRASNAAWRARQNPPEDAPAPLA